MIELIHKCTGPGCLKCKMAQRGYVRSWMGWWYQPNGHGRILTDEEARLLATPSLFPLVDVEREEASGG